jgi:hypothetical protein
MFCSIIVLPAFGGATIKPRWPRPKGAHKSTTRAVKSSVLPLPCSRTKRSVAKRGVRFSNKIFRLAFSGDSKLIWSTLSSAK